jgi:hypothetical protein
MALKHIGKDAKTNRKVIVAYRIVPGEPENCIVIKTESLDAASHDALITAVESNAGQTAYEFAEAMFRNTLPDGMNMLTGMQKYGKMVKVPTSSIMMTPDTKTSINLSELNKMIADQKGVTIAELALSDANGKTVEPKDSGPAVDPIETYSSEAVASEGVLTDEDLAAQYRSQADALYKEAKKLREQAEELVPTKKKTKSNAKETA